MFKLPILRPKRSRHPESPSRAIATLLFEPPQPAPHKREKRSVR
jgi:hypothetical protein